MRWWLAAVALGGTMQATVPPELMAQADRSQLADLIERLQLTPEGAPLWLERLGAGLGVRHQVERQLLVSREGDTLLAVTGRERHVPERPDVTLLLSRKGADILLVHNHPRSTGLAANDLLQLVRPGLAAIAAIGHDGSVYVAAAGPRYGGHQFGRQYQAACGEVDRRLAFYLASPMDAPSKSAIPAVLTHVVASALERASVIEYRAYLAPARLRALAGLADHAGRAIAAAADVVAAEPVQPRQDRGGLGLCGSDNSALSQLLANAQSRVTV